jgi:hypothetical protein
MMLKYTMRAVAFSSLALLFVFSGCTSLRMGKGKKVVVEDFAEGRIVDVSIAEKLTGNRELLFFSMPKKSLFLEGYIQGVITDYQDNPIQGVVVRAVASGEATIESEDGGRVIASSSFDPGVSDTNGFYKIRFSLPVLNELVDVRGRLLYNPGWEQEKENLGKAYEPQMKQSQFRMYYERAKGRITFVEGIRKTVVAPVASGRPARAAEPGAAKADKAALPGAEPAAAQTPPGQQAKPAAGEEDLFKGFGFQ